MVPPIFLSSQETYILAKLKPESPPMLVRARLLRWGPLSKSESKALSNSILILDALHAVSVND